MAVILYIFFIISYAFLLWKYLEHSLTINALNIPYGFSILTYINYLRELKVLGEKCYQAEKVKTMLFIDRIKKTGRKLRRR